MCPRLVEIRSMTAEIRRQKRKKEERKKERKNKEKKKKPQR